MSHANDNASTTQDVIDFDVMNIEISEFADFCISSHRVEPVEAKPKKAAHKVRVDPQPKPGATAKLITGDSLEHLRQMADGSVSVFFFSPPYNKHRNGKRIHFSKAWKGAALGDGYASYSDDMPHRAYVDWMKSVLTECWRVVADDGAIFFQHKDQQFNGVTLTPDELNPGLPLRQRIIWDRGGGPCSNRNFLRPSYEFIHVYAKPKFKFASAGVIRDVLSIRPDNNEHPAPFPVELPQTIIAQLHAHHDVICDPFSGSGSTGVAALAEGRNYLGIELDADYNTKAAVRLGCADPNVVPLTARLWLGNCLELMRGLPDESVDLIACDLPYAATREFWDKVLPMDQLWAEYRRILKPKGNIVLTAAGMFTAKLMTAGEDLFKYPLVWEKSGVTQFPHKDYRVLTKHEDVLVFAKGGMGNNAKINPTYNPQGLVELATPKKSRNGNNRDKSMLKMRGRRADEGYVQTHTNYPTSVLRFPTTKKVEGEAPQTQKPVALMDWIIRTYSNEGDVVLDNCLGSGTTGVAALAAGRHFIGIELNAPFYETASKRIRDAAPEAVVFITDMPVAKPEPTFFEEVTTRIEAAAPELIASNDVTPNWTPEERARWDAKRTALHAARAAAQMAEGKAA